MTVSRSVLRGFLAVVLTVTVLHNKWAAAAAVDNDESTATPSANNLSGVIVNVKQQVVEVLDEANDGASVLNRLQPTKGAKRPHVAGGGAGAKTENKLMSGDALDRFQKTKGHTVAAAKKVLDETVRKVQSTVDDIKRTISGDDEDDEGGDRRISNALDSLLRAVGSEGKAVFEYTSDVLNQTADRAKAAVVKAQQQKQQRQAN